MLNFRNRLLKSFVSHLYLVFVLSLIVGLELILIYVAGYILIDAIDICNYIVSYVNTIDFCNYKNYPLINIFWSEEYTVQTSKLYLELYHVLIQHKHFLELELQILTTREEFFSIYYTQSAALPDGLYSRTFPDIIISSDYNIDKLKKSIEITDKQIERVSNICYKLNTIFINK